MAELLSKIIATFGFVGYLPFVPGTFGSAAGLAIFWAAGARPFPALVLLGIFMLSGFFCAGKAEEAFKKKDHKYIVIDEVCGMFISLLFLPAYGPKAYAAAFLLFRALDTLKPFPAGRIQHLRGSIGIMADDIIAGVYTNLILQVVLRFVPRS